MKASEGRPGRVFMLRLEEGDMLPACIEQFAREKGIKFGQVTLVGGIGRGELVVGPRDSAANQPEPMRVPVDGAHETVAMGIIAPDEKGLPVMHIHGALGRAGRAIVGCLRNGVETWLVGEAIIYEITAVDMVRAMDKDSGFVLLKHS